MLRRQEERRLSVRPNGPAEHTFERPLPLLRFRRGKRILRVEVRVADDDVQLAMEFLTARLGENLDATAAWPAELRRVRVLIDLDLLDGGRRHPQRVHFHA